MLSKNIDRIFNGEASVLPRIFYSERCAFLPTGMTPSQVDFYERYPAIGEYIIGHDLDHLLDVHNPMFAEIDEAIKTLPEFEAYSAFLKDNGFCFAGFSRSGVNRGAGGETHYTTDDDLKTFLLHRVKRKADEFNPFLSFTIWNDTNVIGYAGLFKQQIVGWDLQYERSVFIGPQYQSSGYGKECMIGLTRFAFEQLHADRIFTKVHPDNLKSRNNIERHYGAVYAGDDEFQGEPRRTYVIFPEAFYEAIREGQYRLHATRNPMKMPSI